MNQDQKAAIIVRMLEEASKEMRASKISKATLQAGLHSYLAKYNPPEHPFNPLNKDNVLLFKARS